MKGEKAMSEGKGTYGYRANAAIQSSEGPGAFTCISIGRDWGIRSGLMMYFEEDGITLHIAHLDDDPQGFTWTRKVPFSEKLPPDVIKAVHTAVGLMNPDNLLAAQNPEGHHWSGAHFMRNPRHPDPPDTEEEK